MKQRAIRWSAALLAALALLPLAAVAAVPQGSAEIQVGVIQGSVVDVHGQPVAGVHFAAPEGITHGGPLVSVTDADGRFEIVARIQDRGAHREARFKAFEPPRQRFSPLHGATRFAVDPRDNTGVLWLEPVAELEGIVLRLHPTIRVSGVVRGPGGAPLGEPAMVYFDFEPTVDAGFLPRATRTDPNGSFEFELPHAAGVRLRAESSEGYAPEMVVEAGLLREDRTAELVLAPGGRVTLALNEDWRQLISEGGARQLRFSVGTTSRPWIRASGLFEPHRLEAFTTPHLPPGKYRLQWSASLAEPYLRVPDPVDFTIDGPGHELAFVATMPDDGLGSEAVLGFVVDEAMEPLAGVTVQRLSPGPTILHATTDEEGRFAFPTHREEDDEVLFQVRSGLLHGSTRWLPGDDLAVLVVARENSVSGMPLEVVGADGAPVQRFRHLWHSPRLHSGQLRATAPRGEWATVHSEDGSTRIERTRLVSSWLLVEEIDSAGNPTGRRGAGPAPETVASLVVTVAGPAEGRVRAGVLPIGWTDDAGMQPVADMEILLLDAFDPNAAYRATTGPDGVARIPGLPAGAYFVAGRGDLHSIETPNAPKPMGAGAEDPVLLFSGPGAIHLTLEGGDGQPLAGALVRATRPYQPVLQSTPSMVEARTDAAGFVVLAPLGTGTYELAAIEEDGSKTPILRAAMAAGQVEEHAHSFAGRADLTLAVSRDGEPTVDTRRQGGFPPLALRCERTGEDILLFGGTQRLQGLQEGRYHLLASVGVFARLVPTGVVLDFVPGPGAAEAALDFTTETAEVRFPGFEAGRPIVARFVGVDPFGGPDIESWPFVLEGPIHPLLAMPTGSFKVQVMGSAEEGADWAHESYWTEIGPGRENVFRVESAIQAASQ